MPNIQRKHIITAALGALVVCALVIAWWPDPAFGPQQPIPIYPHTRNRIERGPLTLNNEMTSSVSFETTDSVDTIQRFYLRELLQRSWNWDDADGWAPGKPIQLSRWVNQDWRELRPHNRDFADFYTLSITVRLGAGGLTTVDIHQRHSVGEIFDLHMTNEGLPP